MIRLQTSACLSRVFAVCTHFKDSFSQVAQALQIKSLHIISANKCIFIMLYSAPAKKGKRGQFCDDFA